MQKCFGSSMQMWGIRLNEKNSERYQLSTKIYGNEAFAVHFVSLKWFHALEIYENGTANVKLQIKRLRKIIPKLVFQF